MPGGPFFVSFVFSSPIPTVAAGESVLPRKTGRDSSKLGLLPVPPPRLGGGGRGGPCDARLLEIVDTASTLRRLDLSEESSLELLRWREECRRSWGNNGGVSEEEKVDDSRPFRRDGGAGGVFNGDAVFELLIVLVGGIEYLAELFLDSLDLLGFIWLCRLARGGVGGRFCCGRGDGFSASS